MAPCFVLFVAFLGLFLCLVFGFLVVYSLYTPWGPLFGFNTIAYLSKKKKIPNKRFAYQDKALIVKPEGFFFIA